MAEQPPAISATERLIRSLGNHLTLIETHAAHCRRQIAELARTIEPANPQSRSSA